MRNLTGRVYKGKSNAVSNIIFRFCDTYEMKFALFTLLIVLTYVQYSFAGGCFCYGRTGTFCGFQREHGHLGGDCTRDNMYTCRGGNGALAGWEGRCRGGKCVGSNPAGRDYCVHGSSKGRRKRFISNLI